MPSKSKDFAYYKNELANLKNYDDFLVWSKDVLQPLIPHQLIILLDHHLPTDSIEIKLKIPQGHRISIKDRENKLLFQRIINLCCALQKNCFSLNLANSPERKKVGYEALLKNSSEIITHRFYNAAKQTYHYYLFVVFSNGGTSPEIDKLINLAPLMSEIHKLLHEKIQNTIPWLQTTEHLNSNLTPTEQTIMAWVRLGKTNSEIGQILGVSVFTAKNHLANIFKILNVVSRAQAVAETTQKDI